MKYALFEFIEDNSCEIGESRWIQGEDHKYFDNNSWISNKIVLVKWPLEYSSKTIIKSSIDPECVETKTCTAKVVKFGSTYEVLRQILKTYVDTGCTRTPNHGRGQRIPKRNAKYDDDDDADEDEENVPAAKVLKKSKMSVTKKTGINGEEVKKLRRKYSLDRTERESMGESDDSSDKHFEMPSEETEKLVLENRELKTKLKEKESQIKHLQDVIQNLKAMPMLYDVAMELKSHVDKLQSSIVVQTRKQLDEPVMYTPPGRVTPSDSSTVLPVPNTKLPVPTPAELYDIVSLPKPMHTPSGTDTDWVTLFPHVHVTKMQLTILKSKFNVKDLVYALMSMLWNRDVLSNHSISGKASNAFKSKEAKPQLDPKKVQSICEHAAKKFSCTESEIKQIMTSKVSNVTKVLKAQSRVHQVTKLEK